MADQLAVQEESLPRYWIVALLVAANWLCVCSAAPLELALMFGNRQQRDNFVTALQGFKTETGIEVQLSVFTDAEYKKRFPHWLKSTDAPDVLYWQGGERLLDYARRGQLQPLDGLWREEKWDQEFSSGMRAAVSHKGHTYALPFSYYHWGIFYSRQALQQAGINPPETWEQLLQSCTRLRQHNLIPLVVTSRDIWPALAWFDYLDLRLNGLTFHQQLTRGEIDYRDPRIWQIFSHWKQLIDRHCFNENSSALRWDDGMPYLYHNKGAMTLMGSFASAIPRADDIHTMPFPILDPNMPRYEDAPLDLFVLPIHSTNPDAKRLLRYLGRAEIQALLNKELGTLSPHRKTSAMLSVLQESSKAILATADGFAQYYDRDVPPAFEQAASQVIARFIDKPDIQATQEQLESLRQLYYPKANLRE